MKKNILRILIALALVICTVTVMSSCSLFDFESLFDEYLNDDVWGPEDGFKDPVLPDDNSSGGSVVLPDDELTFYPSDNTDGNLATPLNRTLLSSVIVSSYYKSSPSYGSGVIYKLDKENGDAYIITNMHVVYNADDGICQDIVIYLYGMELQRYAVSATFVGGSVTYDIAVLKVEDSEVIKNSSATQVIVGNSDNVNVFDKVYVVGNPEAEGIAASTGIISTVSEYLDVIGAADELIELRVMRVDAAINLGNSGGGTFNENGELIGIVCAKKVGSEIDNMGYAIPSILAVNIADNIIDNCDGKENNQLLRVLLGIEITAKTMGIIIDPETGDIDKVSLVEISNVVSTSVLLGKLQAGDIITSLKVNDSEIKPTQIHNIIDHMMTARLGDTVTTTVTRGDETLTFTITVTEDIITAVK